MLKPFRTALALLAGALMLSAAQAQSVLEQVALSQALSEQVQRAAAVIQRGGIARLDASGLQQGGNARIELSLDAQPLPPLPRCLRDTGQLYRVQGARPGAVLRARLTGAQGQSLAEAQIPLLEGQVASAKPRLVNDTVLPGAANEILVSHAPKADLLLSMRQSDLVVREARSLKMLRQMAGPAAGLMGTIPAWLDIPGPLIIAAARQGKGLALVDPVSGEEVGHGPGGGTPAQVLSHPQQGCVAVREHFTGEMKLQALDLGYSESFDASSNAPGAPRAASPLSSLSAIAWNGEGTQLAAVYRDHTEKKTVVAVWDPVARRILRSHALGDLTIRSLAFAPDARRLMLATPGGLRILDVQGPATAWALLGADAQRAVSLQPGSGHQVLLRFDEGDARMVDLAATRGGDWSRAQAGPRWQGVQDAIDSNGREWIVLGSDGRLRLRDRAAVAASPPAASPPSPAYLANAVWPHPQGERLAGLRGTELPKPGMALDVWMPGTGHPVSLRLEQTRSDERDVFLLATADGGMVASASVAGLHWIESDSKIHWLPFAGQDVLHLAAGPGGGVWVVSVARGGHGQLAKLVNETLADDAALREGLKRFLARQRVTLWHLASAQASPRKVAELPDVPVSMSGSDRLGRIAIAYLGGGLELRALDGSLPPPRLASLLGQGPALGTAVALSDSGQYLLVKTEDRVRLVDLPQARLVTALHEPRGTHWKSQLWSRTRHQFHLQADDGRTMTWDADQLNGIAQSRDDLVVPAQARTLVFGASSRDLLIQTGSQRAQWWKGDGARGTPGVVFEMPQVTREAALAGAQVVFWGPTGASIHDAGTGALRVSLRWQPEAGSVSADTQRSWAWVDAEAGLLVRIGADTFLTAYRLADGSVARRMDLRPARRSRLLTAAGAWPEAGLAAVGDFEGLVQIIDWRKGIEKARLSLAGYPSELALSRDPFDPAALRIISASSMAAAQLWRIQGDQARLTARLASVRTQPDSNDVFRITPDGRQLVIAQYEQKHDMQQDSGLHHRITVIDIEADRILAQGNSRVVARAKNAPLSVEGNHLNPVEAGLRGRLSDDGHQLVLRLDPGRLSMLPLAALAPISTSGSAPGDGLTQMASGHWLGLDAAGAMRVAARDGRFGLTLARLDARRWVAVDDAGRFDGNDLENLDGLHWITADAPNEPLPIEIFMRDYYEPQLLRKHLLGEALPALATIGQALRLQPLVRIETPRLSADGRQALVSVTVTEQQRRIGDAVQRSGAQDLRLFRDGQLVRQEPLRSDATGVQRFEFRDIALPSLETGNVRFSAYAFNSERIKSGTAEQVLRRPAAKAAGGSKPRAFVLSIGVNRHSHAGWNLSFAVNDAQAMNQTLAAALRASGRYGEVITRTLVSDERSLLTRQAILDALAQWQAGPQARMAPSPDDLVILSFAGHGVRRADGQFHLVPGDVQLGPDQTDQPAFATQTLSGEDLTQQLRGIDAAELLFIVDACQSAAAVEGAGFKPGPLGSRGLGQLAFDKGMRVLAGSQSSGYAIESSTLRHGALTYALVREGIEQGRADTDPRDGRIHLQELLAFTVERVPLLIGDLTQNKVRGARPVFDGPRQSNVQQPMLYDFARRETPVPLVERLPLNP